MYAGHLSVRVRPAYDAAQSERLHPRSEPPVPARWSSRRWTSGRPPAKTPRKVARRNRRIPATNRDAFRQGRKRVENGTIGAMCDHQVVHRSGEIVTRSASRLRHIHGGAPVQHAARRDRGVQGKVLWSYGADEYPVRRKDVEAPRQVVAYPEVSPGRTHRSQGLPNSPRCGGRPLRVRRSRGSARRRLRSEPPRSTDRW